MSDIFYKTLLEWFLVGNTGVSSKTIVAKAIGVTPGHSGYPRDPSDFKRCYDLLQSVPDLYDYLPLLKEPFPGEDRSYIQHYGGDMHGASLRKCDVWTVLVDNWHELERVYEKELSRDDDRMPELYKKMQDLRKQAAGNV